MKDTYHDAMVVPALAPTVFAATTKGNGVNVGGYKGALLVVNTGAIAGSGDYTLSVQESNDDVDANYANVAAPDMIGSLPTSLAAASGYRLGYIGKRPYVRAVITKNSGTSIAASASFVLQGPHIAPLA